MPYRFGILYEYFSKLAKNGLMDGLFFTKVKLIKNIFFTYRAILKAEFYTETFQALL